MHNVMSSVVAKYMLQSASSVVLACLLCSSLRNSWMQHFFMCSVVMVQVIQKTRSAKHPAVWDNSSKKHTSDCKLSSCETHATEGKISSFDMYVLQCGLNSTHRLL